MSTVQEQVAVMMAYASGKAIDSQSKIDPSLKGWEPCMNPSWNWGSHDYRVSPEPREFAIVLDRFGQVVGASKPNGMVKLNAGRTMLGFEEYTTIRVREVL